eukprot:TRINITY_DN26623_c0_g1_i1.p1 TRINITY_DN26623_c0_g1~~TRINITY_DN26623_c0_g1_i1.p1  ORF type:complete len:420 (-),score=59.35 TRINITY_DN26623_c0_g1_i1:7-1179(-)
MAVAYSLWGAQEQHHGPFRAYLSAVCLGSVVCTLFAVRGLGHVLPATVAGKASDTSTPPPPCGREPAASSSALLWPFLRVVARHANFRRYVTVCAVLEAEAIFFKQFDVVLIRVLLNFWPAASRALLVVGDPLSGALSFLLTWVAERPEVGTYGVTLATLRVRLALCFAAGSLLAAHAAVAAAATMVTLSPEGEYKPDAWLAVGLGVLMVLCRAATRPTIAFGGTIFVSVIQEHALLEVHSRSGTSDNLGGGGGNMALSAVVAPAAPCSKDQWWASAPEDIATSTSSAENVAGKYWMLRAALTKPLNSVGPVLGTVALAAAGYHAPQPSSSGVPAQAVTARLWWTCAALPVAISSAVSLLVCPVWGRFTLHGARLEKVGNLVVPGRSRTA